MQLIEILETRFGIEAIAGESSLIEHEATALLNNPFGRPVAQIVYVDQFTQQGRVHVCIDNRELD